MRINGRFLIAFTILAAVGSVSLPAQHGPGGDRLLRLLDPLGILPGRRQVLRTLGHVARVLPPVVIETHGYPVARGNDYDGYTELATEPVRPRVITKFDLFPVFYPPVFRYQGNNWEQGRLHRDYRGREGSTPQQATPIRSYEHDRPQGGRR